MEKIKNISYVKRLSTDELCSVLTKIESALHQYGLANESRELERERCELTVACESDRVNPDVRSFYEASSRLCQDLRAMFISIRAAREDSPEMAAAAEVIDDQFGARVEGDDVDVRARSLCRSIEGLCGWPLAAEHLRQVMADVERCTEARNNRERRKAEVKGIKKASVVRKELSDTLSRIALKIDYRASLGDEPMIELCREMSHFGDESRRIFKQSQGKKAETKEN